MQNIVSTRRSVTYQIRRLVTSWTQFWSIKVHFARLDLVGWSRFNVVILHTVCNKTLILFSTRECVGVLYERPTLPYWTTKIVIWLFSLSSLWEEVIYCTVIAYYSLLHGEGCYLPLLHKIIKRLWQARGRQGKWYCLRKHSSWQLLNCNLFFGKL